MDESTRSLVKTAVTLGSTHGMAHLGQVDAMLEKPDLSPSDLEVLASWFDRAAMVLRYVAKDRARRRIGLVRRLG